MSWARLFNPTGRFLLNEVGELPSAEYSSASLVEVVEHIPPAELPSFVKQTADALAARGGLFVTVPSVEVNVSPKHYQHFCFSSITDVLTDEFEIHDVFGFDQHDWFSKFWFKNFMKNRRYLELGKVSRRIVETLKRKHSRLKGCRRIAVLASKKSVQNSLV